MPGLAVLTVVCDLLRPALLFRARRHEPRRRLLIFPVRRLDRRRLLRLGLLVIRRRFAEAPLELPESLAEGPTHLWQAPAYAETPGPASAFLGAISSRMGLFAILLVLVKLFGIVNIDSLKVPFTLIDARDLLAWIAVFTIIFPTYTAMKQNDARYLLAWHGIGQGGYMLLGIVVADAMGGAGGLLHVFNYAACQAALFLAVTAVIYRTGTSDLNKLGGLVVRMPLSFMVLLVGIIGLAGLPPMNGFVSKWLVLRRYVI